MTEIVWREAGDCFHIDITGHAGYAGRGYDIVCAAVSSTAGILMMLLEEAYSLGAVEVHDLMREDGEVSVLFDVVDRRAITVAMSAIRRFLLQLCEDYPSHVRFVEKDI